MESYDEHLYGWRRVGLLTPSEPSAMQLSVTDDISTVSADDWNHLAQQENYSPFLEHEFLLSLEQSHCASAANGWYPRHFLLKDSKKLIAAAPTYIKTHSMGEFVFDQSLAQAVMALGKNYYPKLVATLPFTPSPGYRFLIDSAFSRTAVSDVLLKGMNELRRKVQLASSSILFVDPQWDFRFENHLCWVHQYFLWENSDYRNFEDYLSRFRKKQRRNIIRERTSIAEQGICVRALTGDEITSDLMDRMYEYYLNTNESFGPWAALYLNREWFRRVGSIWKHRILLFGAWMDGDSEPIALSMVIRKNRLMVGRYWGCNRYLKNLHFELCYYAPVEYAIREGVKQFDPGMGSVHKVRRGFGSREFVSYHIFSDSEIATLFQALLPQANAMERESIQLLDASIPWSKSRGGI